MILDSFNLEPEDCRDDYRVPISLAVKLKQLLWRLFNHG
jgi:hypothetical protein